MNEDSNQAFTAEDAFKATLNILEDIQNEKTSAGEATQAVLNILEDFEAEKNASKDVNLAVMNILEDLAEEQRLTHTLNTKLEQRVLDRTAELARSEERFRTTVESAPTAMMMIDNSGMIKLVNAHTELLFGYSRPELMNNAIEMLVPNQMREMHKGLRNNYLESPEERRMGSSLDIYCSRKDDSTFPAEIGLNPIETGEGPFILVTITDITERLVAQEQRVEAFRRGVLLKEIHHRVKNNLQVVSSLLFLQSSFVKDEKTQEILIESQARISTIALIHEKLYGSKDLERVDFGEYVKDLMADLFQAYSTYSQKVTFSTNISNVFLQIDTAIPCGLIMNELISNTFKHAFPMDASGHVDITITKGDDRILHLKIQDDGVGLPDDFDLKNTNSFGLRLVTDLVLQLDGTIETENNGGAVYKIDFKDIEIPDYEEPL